MKERKKGIKAINCRGCLTTAWPIYYGIIYCLVNNLPVLKYTILTKIGTGVLECGFSNVWKSYCVKELVFHWSETHTSFRRQVAGYFTCLVLFTKLWNSWRNKVLSNSGKVWRNVSWSVCAGVFSIVSVRCVKVWKVYVCANIYHLNFPNFEVMLTHCTHCFSQ